MSPSGGARRLRTLLPGRRVPRDPRFDGWFFTAVTSTGIYCRPSCPALTPKRANVRFYPSAAAAQQAGFRACLRCRPDAAPGSPEWNTRADVVARAMRLIADGVVDREGVAGLAARLGYSRRQLTRLLAAEVGTGPLALARAQRAQTGARVDRDHRPPRRPTWRSRPGSRASASSTTPSGPCSPPRRPGCAAGRARGPPGRAARRRRSSRFGWPAAPRSPAGSLLGFLGERAVPGVEVYAAGPTAGRLRLPHGAGVVTLRLDDSARAGRAPARPTYAT